ncbi:hypothetical protein N7G274_007619 [Stereocaulon virgatum]|uniref:Uncharacterized protein n=1 Tax=Stereocaulon virgatum TaxID=373712 RepID=A0ABR4A2T4_9LECA
MECSSRGRGRDLEQRGKPKFYGEAMFMNPDPFRSPTHCSGPERTESKPELSARRGQDWDGQYDRCNHRTSCQNPGYRHHHDYYLSESPQSHSEYLGGWLPESTRDRFDCEHPSLRKSRPEVTLGNRKERGQRSIGRDSYPSWEARQDTDHDQHSKGSHSCEHYHEVVGRSDRAHEVHQDSRNYEGSAEDGEKARREGFDGGSAAEGEGPGRGYEPEYGGNFGAADD